MNGIGGAIFDQEGEEGVDTTDKPGDDEGVDDEEDRKAAAHGGQGKWVAVSKGRWWWKRWGKGQLAQAG